MTDDTKRKAPDYTNACIVMFGVNLTWIFVAIWAIWGLVLVALVGLILNHLMTRLHLRATARAQEQIRNPRSRSRS